MRYSANLNIIIKAIEKATAHVSRDFSEIEFLQNNPNSAIKFTNACYSKIKKNLAEDLVKMRPEYNLIFADGQQIIQNENAEYSYVIIPVDGLNNLSRGIADFSCAIALKHKNESISVAILKIITGDLYYCEKGFGAFLNNHRIKVSKRNADAQLLISCDDMKNFETNFTNYSLRNYGCRTLEMAYLASSKFDLAFFRNANYEFFKPFELLILEGSGKIYENKKFVIAANDLIKF